MDFSLPQPPGTPIPPTPFPDGGEPSPFYPSVQDAKHLSPADSRRGSVVQFFDPYQTPPASPLSRFPPSSPLNEESGGGGANGGRRAAGSGSPRLGPPGSPVPAGAPIRKPFNFQPMVAAKSPVIGKPSQRRGHRYKHSSVSHQIFLEPPPRAPLSLPASLPVPILREALASITPPQRTRALWCLTHILISGFVLYSSSGSLALTALSHVVLFDALSASVCVAVDVWGNFEVWKRSTIRHPFGLERVEVLAGFAMAVFLLFMGLDIVSHTAEHFLEALGGPPAREAIVEGGEDIPLKGHHEHGVRIPPGSIDFAALLAIIATLISAFFLGNHTRIGKAMRFVPSTPAIPPPTPFSPPPNHGSNLLPSSTNSSPIIPSSPLLTNPSHVLTLTISSILLLLPLLRIPYPATLDLVLALSISTCMLVLGTRLLKALGSMLLMSIYLPTPSSSSGDVIESMIKEIEAPGGGVKRVLEAKVWQVHYTLGMAGIKVLVQNKGGEGAVRERVERIVKERLGSGAGQRGKGGSGDGGEGGVRWEVTVAIFVD